MLKKLSLSFKLSLSRLALISCLWLRVVLFAIYAVLMTITLTISTICFIINLPSSRVTLKVNDYLRTLMDILIIYVNKIMPWMDNWLNKTV